MFKDRKYIFIDDYLEIGKFYAHYGERQTSSIMRAVLQISTIEKLNKYELIPGFLDNQDNFFSCPLAVHYLKINKYEISREWEMEKAAYKILICLHIEIFDLDYSNSIKKGITLSDREHNLEFMHFNPIINFLNLYVYSRRKIDNLNFSIFNKFKPIHKPAETILHAVNNLDLRVFEDSQNRVGKDNRFWTDLEVRNLPNNKYLIELVLNSFSKQQLRCEHTNYGIVVELGSDFGWSPSFDRIELKEYSTIGIRDKLKIYMAVEFDSLEYTLSDMEVNTAHNS